MPLLPRDAVVHSPSPSRMSRCSGESRRSGLATLFSKRLRLARNGRYMNKYYVRLDAAGGVGEAGSKGGGGERGHSRKLQEGLRGSPAPVSGAQVGIWAHGARRPECGRTRRSACSNRLSYHNRFAKHTLRHTLFLHACRPSGRLLAATCSRWFEFVFCCVQIICSVQLEINNYTKIS